MLLWTKTLISMTLSTKIVWAMLWEWPDLFISETNNFFPQKAIEILLVVSAVKYWLDDATPHIQLYLDRKMLTSVFNKVNHNCVIDLYSSRQRTFSVFTCFERADIWLFWGLFFGGGVVCLQVVLQIIIQTVLLGQKISPWYRRAARAFREMCSASTVQTKITWPRYAGGKGFTLLITEDEFIAWI